MSDAESQQRRDQQIADLEGQVRGLFFATAGFKVRKADRFLA